MALIIAFLIQSLLWCSLAQTPQVRQPLHLGHLHMATDPFPVFDYIMPFINSPNRTILPDYEIHIDSLLYDPSHTAADVKLVESFRPGGPVHAAILGPFPSGDVDATIDLTAATRVVQIHRGNAPHFSFYNRYPYSFRTRHSIEGIMAGYYHFISSNGWSSVATIWETPGEIETSAIVAARFNITEYSTLVPDGATDFGEEWQEDVVKIIRRHRMRNVMAYALTTVMWPFVCYTVQQQIGGLQFYLHPTMTPGWFLTGPPLPGSGSCGSDDMFRAVEGYIWLGHVSFAEGVNFLGAFVTPVHRADYSMTPMTCTPDLTPDDFYNGGVQFNLAAAAGLIRDSASALQYFAFAGPVYDQLCGIMLALHDSIYNKNITLEALLGREKAAFEQTAASLREVNFTGPTGAFRFYDGTGDPEYVYFLAGQNALTDPSTSNYSANINGYVYFPDGRDQAPKTVMFKDYIWRDGTRGLQDRPHLSLYPDCVALSAELVWDRCRPCQAGTYYDPLLEACRTCPLGSFQPNEGSSGCDWAEPGMYVANTTSPVESLPCPLGHECPQTGMIRALPCAQGRFANEAGLSECQLCPRGTYQTESGSKECQDCHAVVLGSSTTEIQSTSPSACVCPAGMYLPLNKSECLACPSAMTCPAASDMRNLEKAGYDSLSNSTGPYPQVNVGYMTLSEAPLVVYECLQEKHCPGGAPGTCAERRKLGSIGCAVCEDNAYERGEECIECQDASMLPIITTVILGLGLLVAATIGINRNMHKATHSSLVVVAMAGLVIGNVQAMGIFTQLAIVWTEPLKSIFSLMSLLSFDLDILQVACVFGSNQPLRSFAMRQGMAPAAVPFILVTIAAKKYMPRIGKPATKIAVEAVNAIGTIFNVFFISVVLSAVNPFICYKHPGDTGESMRSFPSILCFEGSDTDHSSFVLIGLGALLVVPIPFLALSAYGIVRYPRAVAGNDSGTFLHALRFLFFRFVPERYYFQIIILLRAQLQCLVPVLFRNNPSTQVLAMTAIIAAYVLLLMDMRPWQAHLVNLLDAFLSWVLVFILIIGSFFLEREPLPEAVSLLGTITASGLLLVLLSSFVLVLRKMLIPDRYDYFLCHHKAGAAAQARLLKIILQAKKKGAVVFIDSDDLQELHKLFDTVKTQVKNLVVYLTTDTLRRPWCAGEIVTAVRMGISIRPIKTGCFSTPDAELLASMDTYLDTSACNLNEYGIEFHHVRSAFEALFKLPCIELDETAVGTRRFEGVVDQLLQKGAQPMVRKLQDLEASDVVLSVLNTSNEAIASGEILARRIREDVFRLCEHGLSFLPDYNVSVDKALQVARQATAIVVMLSPGTMTDHLQLAMMCEAVRQQQNAGKEESAALISVSTPGFEFPTARYYESVLPQHAQQLCCLTDAEEAADLLRAFFRFICVFFPTHASQEAIDVQADTIFSRIQARKLLRRGSTGLPSSGSGSGNRLIKAPTSGSLGSPSIRAADDNAPQPPSVLSDGYRFVMEL